MAKAGPSPYDVMPPDQIKALLLISKREPISAAIGMTADKAGVILLHKKTRPKQLAAVLKAQAKKVLLPLDAPTLRFGTAEVDTDIDPTLVRFRVNKDVPGMFSPKLRDTLKPAGFHKVEFIVDPELDAEPEADGTEAGGEAGTDDPWGPLGPDLAALIQRISTAAAGNAGRRRILVDLATAANAHLKARADVAAAVAAIETLRKALDATGAAPPAAKALPLWQEAKDGVDTQLRTLADALHKTGIPTLASVAGEVETLLDRLRVTLVAALMEYDGAPSDKTRAAALAAVQKALAWLDAEPRVAAIDRNPFGVTVTVGATIGAALRQLQSRLT